MAVTEIKEGELYDGATNYSTGEKTTEKKKKMLIISSLTNIRIKKFSDIFQWQFTAEKKKNKLLKRLSVLQMEILIKRFKSLWQKCHKIFRFFRFYLSPLKEIS